MKKIVVFIVLCFAMQTLVAQKNIAIYWDASYSMKDRKVDRELKFLDNYFKKNSEANVALNMFSNDIIIKDNYLIKNGNWLELKHDLENTIYDGGTSYDLLFKEKADEFLLFTDGMESLDKLKAPTQTPLYIISSVDHANTTNLKLLSDLSSGRFIFLTTDLSKNIVRKEEQVSDIKDGYISGTVSGLEGNLANVSIVNQTSGEGVASAANGDYRIQGSEGDILIFSYLGKKTVSIRISKANIINITMADINQSLDEVVLTAESAEEEEVVNTGNAIVDKKRIGYSIEQIDSDDISELDTDLIGAVKGQFTNLTIQNDVYNKTDISKFLGRGRNMSILLNQYGLIVLDGVPLAQSESNFGGIAYNQDNIINPDMIESITYLKGLAATNKYGTLGRNGVLLITTKNSSVSESTGKVESKAAGTTATYSGNAVTISALADEPYIKALNASKTIDEAFDTYLEQRKTYGNSAEFYLNTYDYFLGWKNSIVSDRILSNVFEVANTDVSLLKGAAYRQQASGNYQAAVKTLEQVLKLEPRKSQSYRDLALAYKYAGRYQDAINLYKRMDTNLNVGNADFSGLAKTISNELRNLIALHGKGLNVTGIRPRYFKPIQYKARIVFEWNDLDAEFDLNIINPQKRYFTWSHTQAENSQRILNQHQQGYGLEEFYLTSDDKGEWKFNMTYYGKTSNIESPTFIKITTYKNYGSSNQSKNIEVVRLDKENLEQTVAKLLVN
ncbi:MAG: TonB-dependent receptor plug domain-containing protein [Bacteroidia bacterium]|nr:TonB-dependent receptor plug domain-containing protein [Bacteroidia bacterium]